MFFASHRQYNNHFLLLYRLKRNGISKVHDTIDSLVVYSRLANVR